MRLVVAPTQIRTIPRRRVPHDKNRGQCRCSGAVCSDVNPACEGVSGGFGIPRCAAVMEANTQTHINRKSLYTSAQNDHVAPNSGLSRRATFPRVGRFFIRMLDCSLLSSVQ
jgi:hypothetical protein